MKSGSSAAIVSHGQSASLAASSNHTSRPSTVGTSSPVCFTTSTFSTATPSSASAASTFALSGIGLPPRLPPSAVTTKRLSQSTIRPASASGEKPPKTTEWTAPSRAQASMAVIPSITIGM